jgi:hypothetical protein
MVVALFLLTGCATTLPPPTRAYKGPELSESQVTKISSAPIRRDFGIIEVLELDGKQIECPGLWLCSNNILVLTGQHEIRVGIRSHAYGPGLQVLIADTIADNIIKKWDSTLHCNAEAGKSYTIFGELIKDPEGQKIGWLGRGKWVYWIEESQSGKVVCGKHPIESETFVNENKSLKQHDYSIKREKTDVE